MRRERHSHRPSRDFAIVAIDLLSFSLALSVSLSLFPSLILFVTEIYSPDLLTIEDIGLSVSIEIRS